MNPGQTASEQGAAVTPREPLPNGAAAAAILATGAGSAALGILAFSGDASKAIGKMLNFYNPSGPLSGVTTLAILFWLGMWWVLAKRWGAKTVAIAKINGMAFALLALGVLLTFPPFADLLQGK